MEGDTARERRDVSGCSGLVALLLDGCSAARERRRWIETRRLLGNAARRLLGCLAGRCSLRRCQLFFLFAKTRTPTKKGN
ncbi:unnamed protein product [Linum trigynum]|uniref:Uncharacterized protein n=1 Tax=Linum trigynum TaxID=586398 RepID=A0AAV2E630_9ROSI